jgi:hypothetical protein
MLAPQGDEILLLQIVFESTPTTGAVVNPQSTVRGRYNRACVRVISIVHRLAASRPMKTFTAALSSAAMTCKENNARRTMQAVSAYLPAGGALLYSGLRSVTLTELNTACFGREEWPSSSQSVLRPFNWEEKNAVSTLSFRLSSKEAFGRRGYCCTLSYHRRAVGGRGRANAESQPYLGAPAPSRWGRASTLSAPDGARASEATRRVAYAEITLIYFGSWNDARHRRRRP